MCLGMFRVSGRGFIRVDLGLIKVYRAFIRFIAFVGFTGFMGCFVLPGSP